MSLSKHAKCRPTDKAPNRAAFGSNVPGSLPPPPPRRRRPMEVELDPLLDDFFASEVRSGSEAERAYAAFARFFGVGI